MGQSTYRENGGDWGVMISEQEVRSEEIKKMPFSLKEGEISEPFLVDLLERKPDGSVAKSGKSRLHRSSKRERIIRNQVS